MQALRPGRGLVELGDLLRELSQVKARALRKRGARLGLRDLQQDRKRALHRIDVLHGPIDAAARLSGEPRGALQFLEPAAQPEERAAQVMRGAVEGGAHGDGLLIQARQHVIDGDRQGIKFVARSLRPAGGARNPRRRSAGRRWRWRAPAPSAGGTATDP